ncbi:ribonuclease J 2 [Firmicutes bacterium CAG:582]|nr:ribonuclease J 2 [Firmicutes bacterium CAG:582]
MSKIKIFGLGGLNEMGKNTYVVEIDGKIFIMDAGIKYANDSMYGIDYILPNYKYLEDNKERIVGVFLTHAHQENMGGVFDLVEHLPKIRVYATKYTKELLLMNGMKEKNIVDVVANRKIGFKNVSVFPINVSHSVPDAVMYVINTHDGAIVYTGDFLIDPTMNGAYSMDLGKIAYVGKQGVLCLMSESVFSERKGHTSPHHRLTNWFKDTFNHADGRIIVSTLPVHLHTIQEIFDAANNMHKKIVVMGKRLQNIINMAIKNGYLNIKPSILGDLSDIESANSILLVCDDRDRPYATVDKIVNGNDKFINLKPTDTVVFAEPKYDATEKIFVRIQDEIAMMGASVVTIPNTYTILHHASQEDLMIMLNLVSPKYYMPVKGEYRSMVNNANLATELGMKPENILLKQNGDVVEFIDGVLQDKFETIKVDDVLIDGKSSDDVGELVIKDREMLGENGIMLISATLDKQTKRILVGPEVTTRGFIYVKDSYDMIEEIKRIAVNIIENNTTPSYVDYNQIKNEIREELSKYFLSETETKPMIIAVIQEV